MNEPDWDALISIATKARAMAYVPYSQFAVGAALLTASGAVVQGCNVENATFGATCCAERTAIFSAIAQGQLGFKAMAVVADTPVPATSCGICRQVMVEFAPDLEVAFANLTGGRTLLSVAELLPHAFRLQRP